jgi:hypothetical protein
MFGYNSDWWNTVVLFALAVAALAALATAFATYAVITTQKREAEENARQFERYKLSVESKVADAKLETERLRAKVAWRRISPEQRTRLAEVLSVHGFAMYFEYSQSDPEAAQFAEDIYKSITIISGMTVYPPHPLVLPPAPPGLTVSGTDGSEKTALESALTSADIPFTVSAAPPGVRIPTHPGHLFQLDGGHRSDLMAATIPN